jgi:hypothetical protein
MLVISANVSYCFQDIHAKSASRGTGPPSMLVAAHARSSCGYEATGNAPVEACAPGTWPRLRSFLCSLGLAGDDTGATTALAKLKASPKLPLSLQPPQAQSSHKNTYTFRCQATRIHARFAVRPQEYMQVSPCCYRKKFMRVRMPGIQDGGVAVDKQSMSPCDLTSMQQGNGDLVCSRLNTELEFMLYEEKCSMRLQGCKVETQAHLYSASDLSTPERFMGCTSMMTFLMSASLPLDSTAA